MNKKIASQIAIGIILLVAVAVGRAVWMRDKKEQTMMAQSVVVQSAVDRPSDETANWQVYENAKYGFQFKYPKEAFQIKDTLSGESYTFKKQTIHKPLFVVMDFVRNNGVILIYNDENLYPVPKMLQIAREENVDLNGLQSIRTVNSISDDSGHLYITYDGINKNNGQYVFVAHLGRDNHEDEQIFDDIVSTFKFQ